MSQHATDRWDESMNTHAVVCGCEQCWRLKVVSLLRDIKDILEHMIEVQRYV